MNNKTKTFISYVRRFDIVSFEIKALHWTCIKLVIDKYLSNFETEITDRHAKKLSALGIKTYVKINANFIKNNVTV